MGRKCSVFGCKTGYESNSSTEKISVYGFPKDPDRCREWLACLPNVLKFEDVGGYVASKHIDFKGDPSCVPDQVRLFTETVSRGGLSFPSHELFVLIMYAYTFIMASKEHSCRSRLVKIISDFPAMFHLNISLTKAPVVRIVNILLKRLCLHKDAATTDQSRRRKIAKLTSTSQ